MGLNCISHHGTDINSSLFCYPSDGGLEPLRLRLLGNYSCYPWWLALLHRHFSGSSPSHALLATFAHASWKAKRVSCKKLSSYILLTYRTTKDWTKQAFLGDMHNADVTHLEKKKKKEAFCSLRASWGMLNIFFAWETFYFSDNYFHNLKNSHLS